MAGRNRRFITPVQNGCKIWEQVVATSQRRNHLLSQLLIRNDSKIWKVVKSPVRHYSHQASWLYQPVFECNSKKHWEHQRLQLNIGEIVDSKSQQTNLYKAWIGYRRTYDSMAHTWDLWMSDCIQNHWDPKDVYWELSGTVENDTWN